MPRNVKEAVGGSAAEIILHSAEVGNTTVRSVLQCRLQAVRLVRSSMRGGSMGLGRLLAGEGEGVGSVGDRLSGDGVAGGVHGSGNALRSKWSVCNARYRGSIALMTFRST